MNLHLGGVARMRPEVARAQLDNSNWARGRPSQVAGGGAAQWRFGAGARYRFNARAPAR